MDEAQWLTSTDSAAILRRLLEWPANHPTSRHPAASDRQLRLFACACCRQPEVWDGAECRDVYCRDSVIWTGLPRRDCKFCRGAGRTCGLSDPRSRRAVEVAEGMADGTDRLGNMPSGSGGPVWWLGLEDAAESVRRCLLTTTETFGLAPAIQAALLRCICGNPWRPAKLDTHSVFGLDGGPRMTFCPWLTPTVRNLVRTIYNDRDWASLGILADALEEAGCTDTEILGHLRGLGPHARGCWAVDLLLGKE